MKVLIAGDYAPIYRIARQFEVDDFSSLLEVKNIVSCTDYSIVNLECPVVEHDVNPILKEGPSLKCSPKGIKALKWAGFNCVTLANNHFYDFGEIGVYDTINVLQREGIDKVGGGINLRDASGVLYKNIEGHRIAILNCCEHEFSIASENSAGSNPLDLVLLYKSIIEARNNAEYVIMIIHGGHEGYQLPSPRMQYTYRFLVDMGADAIINHHQHCFSGYEIYHGKPIFYGLGNFCFEKFRKGLPDKWLYGYMVILTFNDGQICHQIIPYKQCGEDARIELVAYNEIAKTISELNTVINQPEQLQKSFYEMCEQKGREYMINLLSPTSNRYINGLIRRSIIPFHVSHIKIMKALNRIRCESHRDILLQYFQTIMQKNG